MAHHDDGEDQDGLGRHSFNKEQESMKKKAKALNTKYHAVGVRFINQVGKIFTYRVPKRAKVFLGQMLVVSNEHGTEVVVVVEILKEDMAVKVVSNNRIDIKTITQKVAPL